jgi:hypothetical protein
MLHGGETPDEDEDREHEPRHPAHEGLAERDRFLANGDPGALEEMLVRSVREGLHAHVARLKQKKPPAGGAGHRHPGAAADEHAEREPSKGPAKGHAH